ncbi:MAG: response regulator [Lewinellaceae bacterium]|nr:response regulator [Lewinellaceae bacterium]
MSPIRPLILTLILFSSVSLFSQKEYVDSLRLVFQQEQDPVKKIDVFYKIAFEVSYDNPDLELAYADSLEVMSKKAGYKKGLAMVEYFRGHGKLDQGNQEEAMTHFKNELRIYRELKDEAEYSTAYGNMAQAWEDMGRLDSAVVYYYTAMEIDEKNGDLVGASIDLNNIGNIYSREGALDKAIEHFERALKMRQQAGAEKRYGQCYINLAVAYGRKKDFEKAAEYAKTGLDYALKFDNISQAGIITNSFGSDLIEADRPAEAIPWLQQALGYFEELGNKYYQAYPIYNLSRAYTKLGQPGKGLQYAQKGLALSEEEGFGDLFEMNYRAIAEAYEGLNNYKQAFDWYRKYVTIADSILKSDNTQKIAEIEARYETQKKEAQLAKKDLQLERQSSQKKAILLTSIALILLLGGAFYFFRNRQKTRQREAELTAQIERAEAEKLRELNQVKSSFFANISHEFRTPLTLINSPLEQMIEGTLKGDLQKYYRIMLRNGRRLLELVNQLLDLSRLESGKLQLQVAQNDLAQFVRAIAGSFESLAVRRQIDLHLRLPEFPLFCYFDRDKVEKILVNLISNAFKFTGENGRILVTLKDDGPQAELRVTDTGMGIPADQLANLFDRFYYSTQSEVQAGSGLGLSLTKELVELHGGTISVDSKEGKGSSFIVVLPIAPDAFRPEEIVAETPASDTTPQHIPEPERTEEKKALSEVLSHAGKPVLLLVEDNPDVRAFVKEQLEGPYLILEAENGKEGLATALEKMPDLVISDVMMPEMDGMEFCKRLKTDEKSSHIPVIMLTAKAEQSDKLEGLELGADDYLAKPFDARELQIRVSNLLTQRKKLQEHYRRTLTFATAEVEAESMDAAFLRRIREAIEANLEDEGFGVVELGQQVGMSRSQLHRKLSALTGYSPNEVIRNMRLERAKQLLEKKAGTAAEIAFNCGFSSPAYFTKCFKEYFGKLPSEI